MEAKMLIKDERTSMIGNTTSFAAVRKPSPNPA
jgi:hypothetical protein